MSTETGEEMTTPKDGAVHGEDRAMFINEVEKMVAHYMAVGESL